MTNAKPPEIMGTAVVLIVFALVVFMCAMCAGCVSVDLGIVSVGCELSKFRFEDGVFKISLTGYVDPKGKTAMLNFLNITAASDRAILFQDREVIEAMIADYLDSMENEILGPATMPPVGGSEGDANTD